MAEPGKASHAEEVKVESRGLYGTIADELRNSEPEFTHDNVMLLKHHGTYQQDDRDERGAGGLDAEGKKKKSYIFMVRTKIPGGKLTSEQQQAANIVRAFQIGKNEWPWMGVMFLWNLNYASIPGIDNGNEKYGWSVLGPGFANRPAFDAIKSMPK